VKALGNIFLTWRKGKGERRKIVGTIRRGSSSSVRFNYNLEAVQEAYKEGFSPYTDFPEIDKTYTDNVLEVFGQRLIKTDRSDINRFLDFWAINPKFKDDKYYMLAHTQGMLSTDNFEFLVDFHPVKDLCFITEISGLTSRSIPSETIQVGDELRWEVEPKNSHDKNAVKVFKGDSVLGYVKIIHNRVFHKKNGNRLKIKVKQIEKNGHLNRVFIQVSF
jgi:hypothetical protein